MSSPSLTYPPVRGAGAATPSSPDIELDIETVSSHKPSPSEPDDSHHPSSSSTGSKAREEKHTHGIFGHGHARREDAADVAVRAIADGDADPLVLHISDEDNRHVLRKIDKVLLPLTMCAYLLQYIDRSAMSYAAVFTFRKDLKLTAEDYAWLGSVYFIGYLVFEFPGMWLLQRLPISKTMGTMILGWGILVMCMAAPKNFAGMAALRTLLGVTEALITPGFVLLVSRFYKREEQPLRVGLWYSCNGAGSFVGALLSYGMGHVHVNGMRPWAWIFILNGMITTVFAVVFLCLCPESPETYTRFSETEKKIALERVRGNKSSLHNKIWKWSQFREAVCPWIDPQGWAYFIIVLCICIPNGGVANFLHLILQSYGYTAFQTILIGLPGATLQFLFPLSASYISRRWPDMRCYCMMVYMLPALVGSVIQYSTRKSGALLFGYYILTSYVATLGLCIAAPGANVTGYTKRVTVGGMVFIAYATGNIAGPHLFNANETPAYRTGMLTCVICFAAIIPMCGALRLWYMRENRRRDKVLEERGQAYDPAEGDFGDRTDMENLQFRYAL